jgi:hypothetical protein
MVDFYAHSKNLFFKNVPPPYKNVVKTCFVFLLPNPLSR